MRPPIYKPSGAAAEYGEYALNIYDGCPHACPYCYVPLVLHKDRAAFHADCKPRPGIVDETWAQLGRGKIIGKEIFLCFTCDPYPFGCDSTPTREIIRLLKEHGNHVRILTKGDGRRDFNLLDSNDWYGITFDGNYIPKYGLDPESRFRSIRQAKERGIKTWVSFEPVWNPDGVINAIRNLPLHTVPDMVKIGKLNYMKPPKPVDWAKFGREAESLCQKLGLNYYIKSSLREEMDERKREGSE